VTHGAIHVTIRRMPATTITATTYRTVRQIRRAIRAVIVMACGLPLWSACNGGDATAPGSAPIPAPSVELHVHRIVAPDTLRPGAMLAIEGAGFATGALDNDVAITTGALTVHAHVVSVTPTRLDVRLPDAAGFACLPTGDYPLRITSAQRIVARTVTVAVARRITLAKGESLNLLAPSATWCTELDGGSTGAHFAVAVLNTSRTATVTTGLQVRASSVGTPMPSAAGLATSSHTSATAAPVTSSPTLGAASLIGGFPIGGIPEAEHDDHAAHLGRERERTRDAGALTAIWSAERARRASDLRRSGALANVVRTGVIEGQRVQRSAMYQSCQSASTISARVVYAGARAIVLEDVASPRARSMDAQLRAIGREFDEVGYPLLVSQVGDPLALDAAMQGDGRVTMLFTQYVNDSAAGTTGYVTACNLYPRSTFTHSNEAAMFYARVPQSNETPAAWQRMVRSTVVHEAKHLASFAERLSRGITFEEPWLEEATARIAEELYARTFSGGSWRDNTGWSGSLQCEVYQCDDRPLLMWKHFPVLHDYFAGVESLTPLGGATSGDVTFYASGWSLVRWAVDHYALHEGKFVRDLVRGMPGATSTTTTGIAALALRTGRPAEELLAEWSLANLLDDRANFMPARATLSFPGWHVPDLMRGLSAMNGARYSARPLPVRDVTGDRQVSVPPLRGFSASFLEAVVAPGSAQVLELRGANGGVVPSAIRLAIVRVN
jgi:hypothetical protein